MKGKKRSCLLLFVPRQHCLVDRRLKGWYKKTRHHSNGRGSLFLRPEKSQGELSFFSIYVTVNLSIYFFLCVP